MTRILADLPDEEIKRLDRIAYEQRKSRAAVLRDAVAAYQAQPADGGGDWIERGFGLWSRHDIAIDPQDYDRKHRAEWTRPWDDDYEAVRAESPHMFDAEDDRQRQIYLDMIAGKYPEPKSPRAQ